MSHPVRTNAVANQSRSADDSAIHPASQNPRPSDSPRRVHRPEAIHRHACRERIAGSTPSRKPVDCSDVPASATEHGGTPGVTLSALIVCARSKRNVSRVYPVPAHHDGRKLSLNCFRALRIRQAPATPLYAPRCGMFKKVQRNLSPGPVLFAGASLAISSIDSPRATIPACWETARR